MVKILLCFIALFSLTTVSAEEHPDKRAPFKKVVTVIFENANPEEVFKQPMFRKIAREGANFKNFHGLFHPSQPNYIAMTSGSNFIVTTDDVYNLDVKNITNLLDDKHLSWKAYAENYPGGKDNCFTGASDGLYARKHVPFMSYDNIRETKKCNNIVNAQQEFYRDVNHGRLPVYSFYVPNLINDGHDKGLGPANDFLEDFYYRVMKNRVVEDSDVLFILTFDENDTTDPDKYKVAANKIYTVFWGTMVKATEVHEYYDHYNVLTTLEKHLKLKSLHLNDQNSVAITDDIWKCRHHFEPWCKSEEANEDFDLETAN